MALREPRSEREEWRENEATAEGGARRVGQAAAAARASAFAKATDSTMKGSAGVIWRAMLDTSFAHRYPLVACAAGGGTGASAVVWCGERERAGALVPTRQGTRLAQAAEAKVLLVALRRPMTEQSLIEAAGQRQAPGCGCATGEGPCGQVRSTACVRTFIRLSSLSYARRRMRS